MNYNFELYCIEMFYIFTERESVSQLSSQHFVLLYYLVSYIYYYHYLCTIITNNILKMYKSNKSNWN